jgi:uncharacterized phage protein (TIGR01671 family)
VREIKFRVWDKETEYMHVLGTNTHDTLGFIEDGRVFYYNLQNGCGSSAGGYFSEDGSDYILMQYTGLKDKNGKEIYEGDILQADDPNDRLTFSVKWYEYGGTNLLGINTKAFVIIGNIHDNRTLLESGV